MDAEVLQAGRAGAMPAERMIPSGIGVLGRLRWRVFRNRLHQAMEERPLRLVGIIASILVIWLGLYLLLVETFQLVNRERLEGIVATPLIFTFFFLALTGMLAFSNAILCYGTLFKRAESGYLLSAPLNARDVVAVKFVESLALSSWSLILLGIPLMFAMARSFDESWSFYPLFLGTFLLFIPVPGALGLMLAWLVVMFFPRTPLRLLILAVLAVGAVSGWWVYRGYEATNTSSAWLTQFYDHVSVVENALFPHTWVSKGITHAVQQQRGPALFYLFVTAANALFASVLAVGLVSSRFVTAFTRAQASGRRRVRRGGQFLGYLAELFFFYMPSRQRLLAAKDLKTFFRDPLQWSQMAILFGLLILYVSNVQRLWTDLADPRLQLLIGFLNLTAVSLILATFTSRFVFPLVSLDGQQLWLLGLLPLRRSRLVLAKFLYALTLTTVTALLVMCASVWRLSLPMPLAVAQLVSITAICVGLCGISIGMGARMPVFHERNPARIAGGFGGTVSLLVSVALVVASLVGVGLMTWRAVEEGYGYRIDTRMVLWLSGVVCLNVTAAAIALTLGIRHFKRVQC